MGKKTVYEREHIGSVTVKTTIMSFMEDKTMEAIKGLWLFMVGLLAGDVTDMLIRKYKEWKNTVWSDGYHNGHVDTQNHFNEMRRMEVPMSDDVKIAYQQGLTDMQNVYHEQEKTNPAQEYQEGYKMGASVGYSHGLAEPRTITNPVENYDMNIAAKHYEDGYNTGYSAGVSDCENKNGNRMDMLNADIIAWAMRMFPDQTVFSVSKHLLRECMDLCHNVDGDIIDDDLADIYILLITLASITDTDLYYAVDSKNNINKGRQWVYLPDKGYHVHSNSIDAINRNPDELDKGGFEVIHG